MLFFFVAASFLAYAVLAALLYLLDGLVSLDDVVGQSTFEVIEEGRVIIGEHSGLSQEGLERGLRGLKRHVRIMMKARQIAS